MFGKNSYNWSIVRFAFTILFGLVFLSSIAVAEINEFDDVRSMDLSGLDLSDRNGLIETLAFNEETIWPELAQMPGGREPDELMTAAMNPGLGIRGIHQEGITGVGINVAIIDQPIYMDHPEYDGKITAYYDTGCGGPGSSMHGPAVTSLLVGENCGTAPGANVYYAAAPSWKRDAAYYADALNWIVAQNQTLPASEKIRVVSVSAAPSGPGSPFLYNNQMWDDAVVLAEAAGILILDCTNHHGFINRAWYDLDDPENVAECTAGAPGYPPSNDPEGIHVPASCRTTAQHYDYHGRDSYIYWGRGGLSWSIPYCAGVLAMGWQIRPELTKEQMVDLLFQTAYVNPAGAKIINPSAFVALLEANAPTIELSAEEFVFSAVSDGPAPEPQVLSISNSGLGTLNWQINESCVWLDVNPASGNSTGPVDIEDVTLTVTDISPGVHNCQLAISDPCATNNSQIVSITLYVSNANAQTIQDAIDAAEEGDTVVIEPGVYVGDGNRDLDFKGKAITLRSIDPDDPDVVASTIIICHGSETEKHRGFYFHNNETADSVLAGITITGGYETSGGAIYCNNSSPTIRNCVIVDNSAVYGGGMRNRESNTTVVNCIFIGNSAVNWGGGMTNRDCTSSLTVTNCIFTDNLASWGGGMRNYTSSTTVINCTFSNNSAQGWEGGGMSNRDGANPTVINCTFSGNSSAFRGGGIYSDEDSSSTITNCILWENSAQIDNDGPTPVISYSCIQGWTGSLGGAGNIGDDPCFVDAGIGNYHLIADSPCIDAGDPNYVPEPNETDIDGNPRVINGRIDMGAYEAMVSCFGVNHVKLGTKAGKKGNKVELKGTFDPASPIDFAVDDVTYTIDDGQGHVFSFLIPAGSFELEGKGDKDKYKFHSPKGSVPDIKAKFDFDKCKFEFKAKKVGGIDEITRTSLEIILQAGANIAQEIVELEVKGKKGEHLEYKRKPKFECCPKCKGIALMEVTK